jgi:hypothetical protein
MDHAVNWEAISAMGQIVGALAVVDYAKFYSRSHYTIIRVFDESGAVFETHESAGDFKEW